MGGSVEYERKGIGLCPECGKIRFKTRQDAKNAKRIVHPGETMTAYGCGDYFHYGHNELWRRTASDDLIWTPLPDVARAQVHAVARATIGAAA